MPFAIPVRKGFPYTKILNHQIEKMRESGILHQFTRKHLNHDAEAQAHLCSSLEVQKMQIQ